MAKKASRPASRIQLIVSDEEKPAVQLQAGMRFEVVSVPLVDPSLRPAGAVAARLCGSSSDCLALVAIDPEQK
jgi:hypothetical protein